MNNTGQELYKKAKRLIPGGAQLLSKRPEMFLPDQWPGYFSRVKGAEVWDLDGGKYIDMGNNGVGACVLGAADPDVDAAVQRAISSGAMSTLMCPEEVELAELLTELHPWAQMVRYGRGGGEAVAIAVRIARAATGRDRVAFCGYHGWQDWYLAANLGEEAALDGHLLAGLEPAGVPRGLRGTALPFNYNRLQELREIIDKYPGEIGAIVMEPIRDRYPENGFLQEVRGIADRIGAVLVFDEVSAGFRLCTGGAHLVLGVDPDMAVFAKAMSNGYPMGAVIGRREVMEAAQKTFISSTYWTDRLGPTAALATIRKHRENNVPAHLDRLGKKVLQGWAEAGQRAGLEVESGGIPPLGHFHIGGEQSLAAHTLYAKLMLEKGILSARGFYPTFAHNDEQVNRYLEVMDEVFPRIAEHLEKGTLENAVQGPLAHTGFQRLT